MKIQILILDDDNQVIAMKEPLTFEGAMEDLGKLERWWEKQEQEAKVLDNQAEEYESSIDR